MSAKKMIETYVRYGLDEETWDMFYKMRTHELISRETWSKFFETCKSWVLSEDARQVIDSDTNTIKWYVNDDGWWVKA